MIAFLLLFLFAFKSCSTDVPTKISGFGPSEYLPFHPELLESSASPPLDLLRDPDVGYTQNQGIKNFKKSLQVETIIRNPLVVLMPNLAGPEYSAYFLTKGLHSFFEGKPFSERVAVKARSNTILVFDPSVRKRLSFFPVTNFTVVPVHRPEVLARSTGVPWLAFENVTVYEKHSIGDKIVRGRLFHFFLFGDDDWDFFPENSVFDWTRPSPFAFAPPAPVSDKETVTEQELDPSKGEINTRFETFEQSNFTDRKF